MKGKKGGEGPKNGVAFGTATVPCTSKGNIMAAAKKRRRGGAVSAKIEGEKPKERLDKPKRARGGQTSSEAARGMKAGKNYAEAIARSPLAAKFGRPGVVKDAEKAAGKTLEEAEKPERKRGGKVGADTSPMTHAARQKPMTAHSTGGNI